MSAFAGFFHLDGTSASHEAASSMLDRLKHRVDDEGWQARFVRARGPVALGSAVLDSLPQARFEREHPAGALSLETPSGELWLVGDVRLDGREELIARLELDGSEAQRWSDGRLVLEAFARWRDNAPRELKGDFAFAIWDEKEQSLFCARDRFGVRPFYFAFVPGQIFACANEIKALWPVLPFGPKPDEAHIGDYLAGAFDSFSRTFYQGIERLPPAHTLVLNAKDGAPRQSAYYVLEENPELHLGDDDYAARLREGFERAVRQRTRAANRLATFLSGGLDSSSVAAVAVAQTPASQHPLLALSMVFARFPDCDERLWIKQNLELAGQSLEREWVWGDDIGALGDIERVVWHLDGPPPGPNTCSTWTQYAPLQKAGVRVVLDGHGGDEVVFLGYERVGELIGQRRFAGARRELLALRREGITDASATPLLWAQLSQRARGMRGIGRLARALSGLGEAKAKRVAPTHEIENGAAIVRELVLASRRELLPAPFVPPPNGSVREAHVRALSNALQPLALEAMDALGGAHALEVRVPFWEQELIELCLSFPSDQKLRDGWNRWVMRRAMNGILPPGVQWRRAKTNFAPQMIFGLRSIERTRVEAWLHEPGVLKEWIDIERAKQLWEELQGLAPESERAANIAFALWRVLALGVWLRGLGIHQNAQELLL